MADTPQEVPVKVVLDVEVHITTKVGSDKPDAAAAGEALYWALYFAPKNWVGPAMSSAPDGVTRAFTAAARVFGKIPPSRAMAPNPEPGGET